MNCTPVFARPDIASGTSDTRNGSTTAEDAMPARSTNTLVATYAAPVFSGFLISMSNPNRGR